MAGKICIFCGANPGNDPDVLTATKQFVDLLTEQGYDLVYGGGQTGLMGMIADQFLQADRQVIGVRPEKLIADEAAHTSLTELIVVPNMFARKAAMLEMSDAFIALAGGIGTLDEIIEVYTQTKIGFMDKFCGVLNTNGYYDHLAQLLDHMVEREFLTAAGRKQLTIASTPQALLKAMQEELSASKAS